MAHNDIATSDNLLLLPYGVLSNGKIAHISDVESGLACHCTCPICEGQLVAKKGHINIHHFAHYGQDKTTCNGAWETALHLLCKETLLNSRSIFLPSHVVANEDEARVAVQGGRFYYEHVKEEVSIGDIRPDIVISDGSGKIVLIEFYVTHPCNPSKIANIRDKGLSAVEIDLSAVARHAKREEHVKAILQSAPRAWLYHPDIDSTILQMDAAREHRLVELEIENDRKITDNILKTLLTEWSVPPEDWGALHECNIMGSIPFLPDLQIVLLLNIPTKGGNCFSVACSLWQFEVVYYLVYGLPARNFSIDGILSHLENMLMLKPSVLHRKHWPDTILDNIRVKIPDFHPPVVAIEEYIHVLQSKGKVRYLNNKWHVEYTLINEVKNRILI